MKKVIAIVGARPQFIKHAPIEITNAQRSEPLEIITIHTGQHYDDNMSAVFFDELKIPKPKYMLNVGSHSHGKQTALMMMDIEEIVVDEKPDGILVYGDTNSTLAGALVGAKLHVPVLHVEAGLRSFNKEMPEEINRIMTDHVSSMLFAPTDEAIDNLKKEGITDNVIKCGDLMYDMLLSARDHMKPIELGIDGPFYLATIHRPYNTDSHARLEYLLNSLNGLRYPVVLPLHPRTVHLIGRYELDINELKNLKIIEPVSYFSNVYLMSNSAGILTDSGGMQKEAYFLKKKCVTIRKETEWVETIQNGWNTLRFEQLADLQEILDNTPGDYHDDLYGDGRASAHILDIIAAH